MCQVKSESKGKRASKGNRQTDKQTHTHTHRHRQIYSTASKIVFGLLTVQTDIQTWTSILEMGIELNNEGSGSVRCGHCYSSGSVRVRLISGSEFLIHKRISQFWVWFGYK